MTDKQVTKELDEVVIAARTMAHPWERVLKAAAQEGDVVLGMKGEVLGVKLAVFPEFYRLARKAFPIDPLTLAKKFHEVYERRAPDFGYETRKDTQQFDETTPNGRLMVAVCGELLTWLQR